jgi:uncharacterized protein (DUF2236 family)
VFARDSVAWRVNAEAALLLGGGRALLMQLAHPKVAQGVAEHSDFQQDPLARLNRTLELSLSLGFGSEAEVRRAARAINRTHERVRGDGYSALDPELLLWVDATLIDSALVTYREFVGPLSRAEAEAYYRESQPVGRLLGIPARLYPPTLAAFERYVAGMLAGDVQPDETGRRLARTVLRPPIRGVPGFAYAPLDVITAGLLPGSLRGAYGLRWGPAERALYAAARTAIRSAVRLAPQRFRQVPPARRN